MIVMGLANIQSPAQSTYELHTFTTLARFAGSHGSEDGTESTARFYNPWGAAENGAGNIYVTDLANYTIRRVTPTGAVSTVRLGSVTIPPSR